MYITRKIKSLNQLEVTEQTEYFKVETDKETFFVRIRDKFRFIEFTLEIVINDEPLFASMVKESDYARGWQTMMFLIINGVF